jgi:hypothetical protein
MERRHQRHVAGGNQRLVRRGPVVAPLVPARGRKPQALLHRPIELGEHGDPDSDKLQTGLDKTPVLGREPHGDRLRLAFKQAMEREGIPRDVEKMARDFYGRRRH